MVRADQRVFVNTRRVHPNAGMRAAVAESVEILTIPDDQHRPTGDLCMY
jgi:hypothetical protein